MKVEVKKVDAVSRELRFEIPKERVIQKLDEVYKELGKVAKVRGFRPGKIPRYVLESHYAQAAQEEAVKKLIPEAYQEGIELEKLNPIDLPEIFDVTFKEGMVTFKAKLDIKPEVTIDDYKGIKVNRKNSTVTEEELNKTLELFKKGQGEDKEINIDDTFARGLGFPSLEEFKKSLTRQMEMDKDRHNRMDVENQVNEHLLKKTKMVTPPSMVRRNLDRRLAEMKQRLKSQGFAEDAIRTKEDAMRKDLQGAVEKDVRIYLTLERIAELENIKIDEGENPVMKVMGFLLKEAVWEETK